MTDRRTIVVTGATRGLGRALAAGLADEGHVVCGCGRSVGRADGPGVDEPLGVEMTRVDVAVADRVEAWAEGILDRHGPPDLLVNNAALINRPAPLWEVPAEELAAVVDVNVTGVGHVCRAFLPAMVERDRGVIVNLSSGWGRSVAAEMGPYCATKWAVEGMTRALARELPAGMAAVPLNPGIIHTDMLDVAFGPSASAHPGPDEWAERALPFILGIGPEENGQPLTVPGRG